MQGIQWIGAVVLFIGIFLIIFDLVIKFIDERKAKRGLKPLGETADIVEKLLAWIDKYVGPMYKKLGMFGKTGFVFMIFGVFLLTVPFINWKPVGTDPTSTPTILATDLPTLTETPVP